jgi:hypothetical protein
MGKVLTHFQRTTQRARVFKRRTAASSYWRILRNLRRLVRHHMRREIQKLTSYVKSSLEDHIFYLFFAFFGGMAALKRNFLCGL